DGDELTGFVLKSGVVPLAIDDRAILAVSAACMLIAQLVAGKHFAAERLESRVLVLMQPAEVERVLAQDFACVPAEETLRTLGPGDKAEFRIEFDDGEGRIVAMRLKTPERLAQVGCGNTQLIALPGKFQLLSRQLEKHVGLVLQHLRIERL